MKVKEGGRAGLRLCPEASHLVTQEQKRRERLGLPHKTKSDVVNDWLVEHGQNLAKANGYTSYHETGNT